MTPFPTRDGVVLAGPPYKDPKNKWYTKSLFWDLAMQLMISERPIQPIFTLHEDKPGYINARKTFVALNDPTGYKWAIRYLGDWAHWLKLCEATWFAEALVIWRAELTAKIKSEAVEKIREIAYEGEPKSQLPAARFLAELDKPLAPSRGRPTKEEVTGELKRAVKVIEAEDEDLERIGGMTQALKLIKGGK